jgi:hypothetical protein
MSVVFIDRVLIFGVDGVAHQKSEYWSLDVYIPLERYSRYCMVL